MVALYIHVPFCSKICPYCAFYKKKWDKINEGLFKEALLSEIQFYLNRFPDIVLSSIFFGGGTPNLLRTQHIEEIIVMLKRFRWTRNIEVSMEMNPGISSVDKLKRIYNLGVNRCSLGVQSLQENELKFLGRNHTVANSLKSIDAVREAGFKNLNCDLMFGLPNSDESTLLHTINLLLGKKPEHISTYNLSIEPGTPFKRRRQSRAPQEMEAAQYKQVMRELNKEGFIHYEVSNFSKPGFECQHNMAYWQFSDYIGLGPGAHSFFDGMRYHHARDLDLYVDQPIPNVFLQKSRRGYSVENQLEDFIMTKLRLKKGILFSEFVKRFNLDLRDYNQVLFYKLYEQGLIKKPVTRLEVTKKGLMVMDNVIAEILSSLVLK